MRQAKLWCILNAEGLVTTSLQCLESMPETPPQLAPDVCNPEQGFVIQAVPVSPGRPALPSPLPRFPHVQVGHQVTFSHSKSTVTRITCWAPAGLAFWR